MGKRNLQPDNHSIDPCPFEAFWWGSWQTVERLRIQEGAIFMHILKNGEILEENIPIGNLRMKSRRANMSDCTCFLRPGIHICVLLTPEKTEESDTDENPEPVWTDAKISSIERKPHEDKCECKFYINFYVSEDPFNMAKKKLSKDIEVVQIDRISILQRLEQKPIENEYYRWEFTDDCSSRQKFKLFTGKFSSDLSWMVVTSVLKQLVFDVQSIGSRIVYQISDCDDDDDVANPEHGQQRCCRNAITFRVDNELTTSVLVPMAAPEEAVGPHHEDGLDRGPRSVYDLGGLRRSKRRYVQPDRYLACDDAALLELLDTDTTRVGIQKTSRYEYVEMPMALSIQADHACQFEGQNGNENMLIPYEQNYRNAVFETQHKHKPKTKPGEEKTFSEQSENCPIPLDTDIPEDCSRDIRDLISDCGYTNGSSSVQKKRNSDSDLLVGMGGGGWEGKESKKRGRKRKRNPGVRESIYDVRSFKKGSVSASLYRELIKRCMRNIEAEKHKEQPPIIDQWKEFQRLNQQKEFEKTPSNFYKFKDEEEEEEEEEEEGGGKKKEEEDPELEMLWKEMELAMASTYFLDDNEGSHVEDPAKGQMLGKRRGRACRHEYKLNEEIGIICRFCGFVAHEIRDVRPSFVPFTMWAGNKERATDETSANDQKPETDDHDLFNIPNSKNGPTSEPEEEEDNNVWALIPDLKPKLRFHQKRAFEFLWRNLAGSILPAQMEPASKMRGGCVISHSPGAGKTLLIIAFLVSYLKLFPGSRPLVLAPKTTLYTWYKEIIKWEIPVPVYQIHGGQTYKGEVIRQKIKLAPGIPRNQDVMHVLDCLEKIQKWLANPSVLLMGYTSFLTLTREDSKNAHRQYMARVLKQCPGILILDEGHNPRSTKSRLRKALMKVETGLRVLLSGTLFQNNFGEYFNTLCLARPRFVHEVLKELDPKFKKNKKGTKSRFSLENRARKYFVDKISRKIDSNVAEERLDGLNVLKNLSSGFIDVYEGSGYDRLPGLQCYTLMMKPTPLQQGILEKLQNQRPVYKGFPLELELLITLGAIHPWLIRTTACSNQYFSPDELTALEKFKFDLKLGSKVRFVMSLVPRCLLRNEKVLIFCHNIAPINLFLEIFDRFYGWKKGEEVLVLQGDLELFERGRVMDRFEEPMGPSKVMLASITACAEGISLTAASRVILLDSEWNPSRSKQAIARAFRPGQDKVVYVYQLLANGTLEEEKFGRTTWKEWVSSMIFSEELVDDPSCWQAPKIEDELLREIVEEDRGTMFHMIMKNEKASNGLVRGKELAAHANNKDG